MSRLGDLARTDELPDVGAPLIPSGPQVSPGVGWANRLTDRLPSAVMGGLAQMVQTPGALMKPNPYLPGSEEAAFYDATKTATAAEWAPGMALNMMGGGVAGTGKGGGVVVGSGPVRKYPEAPRSEWYGDANYETTGGRMTKMTPDEYLAQTRPMKMDDLTLENIADLKAHIEAGKTLDPLALYKNMKEDGRHRAHAAKELGIEEVPVINWRDVTLGSGATDKKMGAILAATDNQSSIKAYHSSPHDFDKFDLSKIGTGEGSRGPSQQISTLQAQLQKPGWLPDTRAGLQSQLDELLKKPAPTSNYVVFDPSIVDIIKKYGIAGAAPAGMGALAAQDYYRNR